MANDISSGLPSGYEFGYDQITSPVTISASSTPGTTVISCAAHWFDGGSVLLHFFMPDVEIGSADISLFRLFEGSTNLGRVNDSRAGSGAPQFGGVTGFIRFTPTAGFHTYTITGQRGTNNAVIDCGVGGSDNYIAAFARFTKV